MISGAHVIVYSKNAEADRAFFRDVLGFKSVDAGRGWLGPARVHRLQIVPDTWVTLLGQMGSREAAKFFPPDRRSQDRNS